MDNGDILENNEEFLNNINSTLNVKRDYDMKELDYEWIDIIEDVLPYLDNILRNPKRFIINEEEIVKVELARKVTVESVIHLTQHTNFIQKIDKNGDVKPSKILNINREESLDTYENRFIFTLLNNLRNFYEERVSATGGTSYCLDKNNMIYIANSKVNSEEINVKFEINDTSKVIKGTGGAKNGFSFEDRLKKIKIQMDGFFGSELYTTLTKLHVPPVRSPIRHTNVILKNPNFKKAEELWNYIQAFVSKDKREKNKKDYFDKGNLKNQYDQAFLMTFIANKNLIENSTSNNESNIINQMMKRLINNLLDSMEDVDEDRIKEMFIKQCDMIKKDNIRKSNNIKGILVERFKRENSSIDSVFNYLKGE